MHRRARSPARSSGSRATGELRRRLIQGGYATARAHTLERQAADMMRVVVGEPSCRLPIRLAAAASA